MTGLALVLSPIPASAANVEYTPDVTFTLRTGIAEGKLVFFGESGAIKGVVNPTLEVPEDAVVQINIINGDGAVHDIASADFGFDSDDITGKGSSTAVVFRTGASGEFVYYCSLPGHRAAGMEGRIMVGDVSQAADAMPVIAADPAATGETVGDRAPARVAVELTTAETTARLGNGTSYRYWTFNEQVPGPFIRARVGDTVSVRLTNAPDSTMIHSVDLHAVTGPGGGAVVQVPPGESRGFDFLAMKPGLYVYHCATPMVAQHIANGMYGLILVEPAGGLAGVDREFYVMQGEMYTAEPYHTPGHNEFALEKMLDEQPTYYVFNGAAGALTKTHRMEAEVGETVRIYFGVGGPNKASSFHVIGEIFDRVYTEGDLISAPAEGVQTTTVAPGGATMVEFAVEYPGRYILVDHALARVERGLAGFLYVDGERDDAIFRPHEPLGDSGGH
jgi:nitrite reductase (NO-forming)